MARFPVPDQQASPIVTPSRQPFTGPMSIDERLGAAEGNQLRQVGADLQRAANALGEVAIAQKHADDTVSAQNSLTDFMTAMDKHALEADSVETFRDTAQKLMSAALDKLPSQQARERFRVSAQPFLTRSVLGVQHKLFLLDVQAKRSDVESNLDTLARQINMDPDPGKALLLENSAHQMIDDSVNAKVFHPVEGKVLKEQFGKKLWFGVVERRAMVDPVETRQEIMDGGYNDKLDPHQITQLLNQTESRINSADRMARMQERLLTSETKRTSGRLYESYVDRFLNMNEATGNPYRLLAEAEQSGLDQAHLNRLHRMVNARANSQVARYRPQFLRELSLPENLDEMMAKRGGMVRGIDSTSYQEYLNTVERMKRSIKGGMPADIAGGIILNELKQKRIKGELGAFSGANDSQYPPPDGFQGNADDPKALRDYALAVRGMVSLGKMTPYQGALIRTQIQSRLDFLQYRAKTAPQKH